MYSVEAHGVVWCGGGCERVEVLHSGCWEVLVMVLGNQVAATVHPCLAAALMWWRDVAL